MPDDPRLGLGFVAGLDAGQHLLMLVLDLVERSVELPLLELDEDAEHRGVADEHLVQPAVPLTRQSVSWNSKSKRTSSRRSARRTAVCRRPIARRRLSMVWGSCCRMTSWAARASMAARRS